MSFVVIQMAFLEPLEGEEQADIGVDSDPGSGYKGSMDELTLNPPNAPWAPPLGDEESNGIILNIKQLPPSMSSGPRSIFSEPPSSGASFNSAGTTRWVEYHRPFFSF